MYYLCGNASAHVALCPSPGWRPAYMDGETWFPDLFGGSQIGPEECCNYSLVGAGPKDLERWGYDVTSVPGVDDRIARCRTRVGPVERPGCWGRLDRWLMERVVPWVPYATDRRVEITSSRVTRYSYDQFAQYAALDRIVVRSGG